MRKCLNCSNFNYKIIKKIGKAAILECLDCRLAFTIGANLPKKRLYSKTGPCSFSYYKKTEDVHLKKAERIIEVVKTLISKGRVLEVGCGFGLFANELSKYKQYEVEALEPNLTPYCLKDNKSVKVQRKTLQNFLKSSRKKYDMIIFIDVLEHFNNPDEILDKIRKIVLRRGYVLVVAPNYKSIMAKICKNWSWWMPADHKYHFSPRSLRELVGDAGFKPAYLTTFETLYDMKKNLDGNYLSVKNPIFKKLLKIFTELPILLCYAAVRPLIWSAEKGGLILIVGQKHGEN